MAKEIASKDVMTITTKTVGGKEYIIKSVFVGKQDIKTAILKLAERKAFREMGLDGTMP